ncbi:MAG: hypothetical protein ACREMQ_00220, partial [Longimicrobiales bacterium]
MKRAGSVANATSSEIQRSSFSGSSGLTRQIDSRRSSRRAAPRGVPHDQRREVRRTLGERHVQIRRVLLRQRLTNVRDDTDH